MKRVFFLVNNVKKADFKGLAGKYLPGVGFRIGSSFPKDIDSYDLAVLWSYKKIIKDVENFKNVILFHSSDLPKGKGWAPIYYSLSKGEDTFTITGLKAANKVDSGDIIVKARFRIRDNYTAEALRKFDHEISFMLIKKILERFEGRELKGKRQSGRGTFYKRRYPKDSRIDINRSIRHLIGHLRGCENDFPAFFYFNNARYNIYIEPVDTPVFPSDLRIKFYDTP